MYDYGARNYAPALGRFMNIDPMVESYYQHTSYNYVGSNPVVRTDPTGMDWYTYKKGNQTYNEDLTKDNASSILKKGEKYSGTTVTENVSNDAGNYTLTYNADGSINLSTPQVASESLDNAGSSYGIGIGGAVGGGIGLELGVVQDATNNWGVYFSFKANACLGGGGLGVNITEITPTHDGAFLLNDFAGISIEGSVSANSPFGGGGVSFGGTSPPNIPGKEKNFDSISDRFSKIGTDKRGYTTGSVSPELNGPSAKVSVGAMVSKSKTWVWDF